MENELKSNQDMEAGRVRGMVKRRGVAMQDLAPRIAPHVARISMVRTGISVVLLLICQLIFQPAVGAEEKVYRTGIRGLPRYFSVSPNGDFLIFDTGKPIGGMNLLDLRTGTVGRVPAEVGRVWDMGNISRDGQYMVAVSTGLVGGKYNLGDMKIIEISLKDWSWRELSPGGDGVKITPFYSADGRNIFYFKGAIRTDHGATPAADYDLYVIRRNRAQEERLTDRRYYQVADGDTSADGNIVYFSRYGGEPLVSVAPPRFDASPPPEIGILSFDLRSNHLGDTQHFSRRQYVEITRPKLDAGGRLYFIAVVNNGKGPYANYVVRDNGSGGVVQRLAEVANHSRFGIARISGDIYVSDIQSGEVIFRRLAINANQ